MRKRQSIQLNIPKPCSEDWDKMTDTSDGKFCAACNHCVVDFTAWTDEMIAGYIQERIGSRICGRLRIDQLNRGILLPAQRPTRLYKLAIAASLVLIFSHPPQTVARPRVPFTIESSCFGAQDSTRDFQDTNRIIGQVLDEQDEPIIGAVITLHGERGALGGDVTNEDGLFSIAITVDEDVRYISMRIMYAFYRQKSIKLADFLEGNRKIKLEPSKENESIIIGLIEHHPPLIDKANPGSTTTFSSHQIRNMNK